MILTRKRNLEYFELDALRTATGVDEEDFGKVIVKELVDNALDATEKVEHPHIVVCADLDDSDEYVFTVEDNGPGLSREDLEKIIDFDRYASSKSTVMAPTRGRLGNALKTIIGIPIAMMSDRGGVLYPLTVHSRGRRFKVQVLIDPTVQELQVSLEEDDSEVVGTRFEVRTYLNPYGDPCIDAERLIEDFALCTPNAHFEFCKGSVYHE